MGPDLDAHWHPLALRGGQTGQETWKVMTALVQVKTLDFLIHQGSKNLHRPTLPLQACSSWWPASADVAFAPAVVSPGAPPLFQPQYFY